MILHGQTQQDGKTEISKWVWLRTMTLPMCIHMLSADEPMYKIEIGNDKARLAIYTSEWYRTDGEPTMIYLN